MRKVPIRWPTTGRPLSPAIAEAGQLPAFGYHELRPVLFLKPFVDDPMPDQPCRRTGGGLVQQIVRVLIVAINAPGKGTGGTSGIAHPPRRLTRVKFRFPAWCGDAVTARQATTEAPRRRDRRATLSWRRCVKLPRRATAELSVSTISDRADWRSRLRILLRLQYAVLAHILVKGNHELSRASLHDLPLRGDDETLYRVRWRWWQRRRVRP